MGDLTFKPIGDIQVGDEVIGFASTNTDDTVMRSLIRPGPITSFSTKQIDRPVNGPRLCINCEVELPLDSRRRCYCSNKCNAQYYKRKSESYSSVVDQLGFGRGAKNRLCKSTVVAIKRKRSSIVKITMASGKTIRCTSDHKWLRKQYKSWHWNYGEAKEGWYLANIIDPTPQLVPSLAYESGWLSGIYDGEGHTYTISQCKNHNPDVYQEINNVAEKLGISMSPNNPNENNDSTSGWVITGGRQGYVDFLNKVRPVRRKQLESLILGSTLIRPPDQIITIEEDSLDEEVVCLTTTTGNYVIWGYASKNSRSHPESIEELMNWPFRRFLKAYEAHQRRTACDEVKQMKLAHISGLHANTNLDGENIDRAEIMQKVAEAYDEVITKIWNGYKEKEDDPDDPFFKATKRNQEIINQGISLPGEDQFQ